MAVVNMGGSRNRDADRFQKPVRPLAADQRKDVIVGYRFNYLFRFYIFEHHFVFAHLFYTDTESQIDQSIIRALVEVKFVSKLYRRS